MGSSATNYVNSVKTMKEPSEEEITRETISDLEELIDKLEEDRDILDWRIDGKRQRLRWYQANWG